MRKLAFGLLIISTVLLCLSIVSPALAEDPAPGDANGDGDINAGDITKIERIIPVSYTHLTLPTN